MPVVVGGGGVGPREGQQLRVEFSMWEGNQIWLIGRLGERKSVMQLL